MSKCWVFTINNPKPNHHDLDGVKGYDYCIVGNEVGDNGTPHLQGFIIFKTRGYASRLNNMLPPHWHEPMRGTSTQARAYCQKDGDYFEDGLFYHVDSEGGKTGGQKTADNYLSIINLCEQHKFDQIKAEHSSEYFRHYHTMKK